MLKTEDGAQYSGRFEIDGRTLDGELTFDGPRSKLYVHSPDFFRPDEVEDRCVKGVLHDLTKVSLFDCLAGGVSGSSWSAEGSFSFADITPHYVVHGRRHLEPKDKAIRAVTFVMSDAHLIFRDYDSFLAAFDPKPSQIRPFIQEYQKVAQRRIPTGRRPLVALFTGRQELIRAKTTLGTVTISNGPWSTMGNSKGIQINNDVWTKIAFDKPSDFQTALSSIFPVLNFMEIMAGRKQEISLVRLLLNERDLQKRHLEVYWTRPPKRTEYRSDRDPHVTDLPIDAIRERRLFTRVFENWIAMHDERKLARGRFSDGFTQENWFDTDRLIGAANMFDLLPASTGPKALALPPALKLAHDESRKLFRALPQSVERDSVLNALGRLKQPSLKRKIHRRAKPIIAAFGDRFPHLEAVIDLAVDARNYFVHGGPSKHDFTGPLYGYVHFFTETLEFIFAASDLHDAGWPIENLAKNGTIQSHPFGHTLVAYGQYVHGLKALLPPSHPLNAEDGSGELPTSTGRD
jgi:hypothetical protein